MNTKPIWEAGQTRQEFSAVLREFASKPVKKKKAAPVVEVEEPLAVDGPATD